MPKQQPSTANARKFAVYVLNEWEKADPASRPPLAALLEKTAGSVIFADPRDRALLYEIVTGVIRWLSLLDWHIKHHLHSHTRKLPGFVMNHLRAGTYQILFLDRIPPSAAVNEAVRGIKSSRYSWASGLVNAVLRRLAGKRKLSGPKKARTIPPGTYSSMVGMKNLVRRIALEQSHPEWMVKRWTRTFSPEKAMEYCRSNNRHAPLALRINTRAVTVDQAVEALESRGISVKPGLYSPVALILEDYRGAPAAIPGFEQGWFQVQDEAAQLISFLVAPEPGETVLDACAGPGGKTTHIAAIMADRGTVHAIDRNRARLKLLEQNQARLGLHSISAIRLDLSSGNMKDLKSGYHRILLDAPCSGLGVIRRHPDIKWNRTPDSILELSKLQGRLLATVVELVKPGGRIVYSVCTLEPEETTDIIEGFLKKHRTWRLLPADSVLEGQARNLVDREGFLFTIPVTGGPDGFFAAVLQAPCP